jgi:cell division protein FtsW
MSSNSTVRDYARVFKRPELPFYLIIWSVIALSALGLTMVLSASSVKSLQDNGSTYSIFIKQFFFLILASGCAYWAFKVKGAIWLIIARYALLLSIIFLAMPLVPGLGKNVNGNRNWIEFAGFTLQPSEFAKLGLILWCALHLKKSESKSDDGFIKNPLIVVMPGALAVELFVLGERDLGTGILIFAILGGIIFIAGAPLKMFGYSFMAVAGIVAALVITSPNRMHRFAAFLNPFDEQYYKFAGWQPAHSIMGLASGGLFGAGLGASKQKWANLAEAHTDFIFAVIGEELGLLGTLVVLLLFAALIYGIFRVSLKTKDSFSRYATAGIACWFLVQVTVNIASVTSLLPVIGVTLPFISYGGSSLIANFMAIGFVLGVARRTPEIAEGINAARMRKLGR